MDDDQTAPLYFTERNVTVLAIIFARIRPFQTRPFENFLGLFETDLVINEIRRGFFRVSFKLIIHVIYTFVYTCTKDLSINRNQLDHGLMASFKFSGMDRRPRGREGSALARLEAGVFLVDDVDPALPAHDDAILMPQLGGF